MGTTASTLTSSNITKLQQFNAFLLFPDNRFKADKFISSKATNAIKYINTHLSSPLGCHGKKKQNIQTPVDNTLNFQSRRRIACLNPISQ